MKTSLTLFLVLGIGQPVLAYLEADVQRLLETNSCEQCDLTEANLRNADLKYANLSGADLTGANLMGVDLGHANIDGSNFSDADVSYGQLNSVNLSGAIFRGANLSGVDLTGADLNEMDFTGANLREAILSGAELRATNLSRADLSRAILVRSDFSGAKLNGTDLSWAYLYKAKLIGADLGDANLEGARLSEADLTEANLAGSKIDLAENQQDGSVFGKSAIAIQSEGGYQKITSFDLNGASKYMTAKSGQLYKSNEEKSGLFGLLRLSGGTINLDGENITGMEPAQVVRKGVCYVPQTDNVFPTLSVEENLEMGAYIREDDFRPRLQEIYQIFPPLREKRKQKVGFLSGGQRQMVAMGKALMLEPRILLLDEPTAGLSPIYRNQIFDIVKDINDSGIPILMVEQNAKQSLAVADRGYVLVDGQNRTDGNGLDLLNDPEIAEMFLGG